jgi:hypothetical protein
MANVSTRTANWRLFGGGGVLVGALLWTLHLILVQAGVLTLGPWLFVIGLVLIAIGFALVAFGETGSNGAVGKSTLGKAALVAYALGFLLLAVDAPAHLGTTVQAIAAILLIIGGLVSAYVIFQKGVAKGIARWFLFVPAVVGALWAIGFFGVAAISALTWLALVLAILLLVTGVLYLFNDRKMG